MNPVTFVMVLVCGLAAIAALFGAGVFLQDPFAVKMAVVAAFAMYCCQALDAIAVGGGRLRLLYGAAIAFWATAIIAAAAGLVSVIF